MSQSVFRVLSRLSWLDPRHSETEAATRPEQSADRGAGGARARWLRFLIGLAGILIFAFGVIPAVQRLGPVRDVCDAIERANIDATALVYTETPISSEAQVSIRSALRYAPRSEQ